ncbi:MAG TPA: NrtA/SsuA/CpmA family ABC transporter substrate-binding protein [Roseateles sp.]|nr:NrtA/SsuA/CpmA family ABC transporter substrate-binding protein [Roseateles sp.]
MSAPPKAGAAGRQPGRRMWVIACLVLALILVPLCLLAWYSAGKPAPGDKLSIAVPSAPHAALLHIAAARQLFAAEGLDVSIVPTTHGKVALDQLAQGKVDLAAAAEVPFVVNVMNGQPLAILASVASASSEMAVIARRDRQISRPGELAGKRIGITRGTSGEYYLWAFLTRHKLAPDSVTLVDAPPDRLDRELVDGRLDAIAAWQPTRGRAVTALGEGAVSLTEPHAYTATYVLVGRNDYLRQHPRILEKLLRALLGAEAFQREQPQQALQLVAERLRVEPRALTPSWQDQDFRVDLLQSQLITLEDEARWAAARGYAPAGAAPNFLSHLHLDALLAVRPERVTVVH